MGSALTGNSVSSTYNALLKTSANATLTGTLTAISDGLGNNTPLQVSTAAVAVVGPLTATNLDSTIIGATTPSTGAFTTLSASGASSLGAVGASTVTASDYVATPSVLTYAATTTIDFSSAANTCQQVTLTGNVTFNTSNLAVGRAKKLLIIASGGPWTITCPSWLSLNSSVPTTIASGKYAEMNLFSWGATDASVSCGYAVTP